MVSSPWCCGFAGDAPGGVVERGRAFRVGARLAGDAPGGVAEGRGLCRRGTRQRQREGEREGDPGHWLPSAFLAVIAPFSSQAEGSLSVLVERHGAMNPAGRVRIRNIMPTVRDTQAGTIYTLTTLIDITGKRH